MVNIDLENKKILFIDLDGTLIQTISGKTFPEDVSDFRIQLSVLNKIKEKLPCLEIIFIVTNQGGIGTYYTKTDVEAKIFGISNFVENYLDLATFSKYCDSTDKNNPMRKPNTGMLDYFMYLFTTSVDKSETIMIGDASGKEGDFSDSDKKCAENFGCEYIDVKDFLEL